MSERLYLLGDLARRYGIPVWKLRRVFELQRFPEPPRVGFNRVLADSQLPAFEQVLRELGYLKTENACA
jgi:hypothetical protein